MHAFNAITLAALTILPAVSAHGYVSGVIANGVYHSEVGPNWKYMQSKPAGNAGWFADDQDNGFVASSAVNSPDIICHKSATPGTGSISVAAGSTMKIEWNTWPDSHHGPVLNYLARCPNADCTKVKKGDLKFFKVEAEGLDNPNPEPGTWATDKLINNNFTASLTLPSDLSGSFVLRHEIIALHSAGSAGGAQMYPQCLNLKITGSGNTHPCLSGAKCDLGIQLYKENAPGILINIYTTLKSYTIPGPPVWSGLKKRLALPFSA